jgi:voltage-gated potassium channel
MAVRAPATPGTRPGSPRDPEAELRLQRFSHVIQVPLILSALLPLLLVPGTGGWVGDVVGVVTWIVFVIDLVVEMRYRVKYLRSGYGMFDLAVVVLTAPWYLIPGVGAGRFVLLLRLARLVRVILVTRGARRLFSQLGRVAIFAGSVLLVSCLVAYHAEHPVNSEFATFGDALWWGIVTLTTVGYGDIVPKTTAGRWAGVAIMLTGVAVLGLLAGSLASFFRLQPTTAAGQDTSNEVTDEITGETIDRDTGEAVEAPTETPTNEAPPDGPGQDRSDLVEQITELRDQIAHLAALIERQSG